MMSLFFAAMGFTLGTLFYLVCWGSCEQAAAETKRRNEALARAIAEAIEEIEEELDRDESQEDFILPDGIETMWGMLPRRHAPKVLDKGHLAFKAFLDARRRSQPQQLDLFETIS